MDNQIKQEQENTHRFLKKSRNSDEKMKKANDDLEPILVMESRSKIKKIQMENSEYRLKNYYSSKTSVCRAENNDILVENSNTA